MKSKKHQEDKKEVEVKLEDCGRHLNEVVCSNTLIISIVQHSPSWSPNRSVGSSITDPFIYSSVNPFLYLSMLVSGSEDRKMTKERMVGTIRFEKGDDLYWICYII